jgi:hypothetical protein
MRGEGAYRRAEQHVIVLCAKKAGDGDHAVAAWSVFNDNGLTPTRGQLVGDESRADIDAATRSQRHDEVNRPAGPGVCRRARAWQQRQRCKYDKCQDGPAGLRGFTHGSPPRAGRPLKAMAVAAS